MPPAQSPPRRRQPPWQGDYPYCSDKRRARAQPGAAQLTPDARRLTRAPRPRGPAAHGRRRCSADRCRKTRAFARHRPPRVPIIPAARSLTSGGSHRSPTALRGTDARLLCAPCAGHAGPPPMVIETKTARPRAPCRPVDSWFSARSVEH